MKRAFTTALVAVPVLITGALHPASATSASTPASAGVAAAGIHAAAHADCSPTTLTRSGAQGSELYTANTSGGTWDLTGASWTGNAPTKFAYPIRSESWGGGCIVGGEINGTVPRTSTRDQWYNGSGHPRMGGEVFRVTLTPSAPGLTIRDGYASDYEDAFDPNAANVDQHVLLDHVKAEYIRDDCIENEEAVASVTLRNSLLDGCFTAFAERPPGATSTQNGKTASTFTVEDSLVYVQPQPLGSRYCDSGRVKSGRCATTSTSGVWMGAYGIWKWSDKASANVVVRNTVFRMDMPSYSSCQANKWPAGTYQNVTLVWTGKGDYAKAGGCTNTLPAGVRLSTDVGIWNTAVAAWEAGR